MASNRTDLNPINPSLPGLSAQPSPQTTAPAPTQAPAPARTPVPTGIPTQSDPAVAHQIANAPGGLSGVASSSVTAAAHPALAAAVATATPTPEDIKTVGQIFAAAVKEVTSQDPVEISNFLSMMAPLGAVYLAKQRAGDADAGNVLSGIRTTALMMAANSGVKLLQSSEQAFLAAIGVGFRMALGPAGALAAELVPGVVRGVGTAVDAARS